MNHEPTEQTPAGQQSAHETIAALAGTAAITLAPLDPQAFRPTPVEPAAPVLYPSVLLYVAAIREYVAGLLPQVPHHGVSLDDMTINLSGEVTLYAWSIHELNNWHAFRGRNLAVSQRRNSLNGRLAGGLDWSVGLGRVPGLLGVWLSVVTETREGEVLPDLLVVRHGAPWAAARRAAAVAA